MAEKTCKLVRYGGTEADCAVHAFVASKIREHPPILAWGEPDPLYVNLDNQTGRRDDFVPLVVGTPAWPENLPLAEVRLFWPDASLHVVDNEAGGCRWFRVEERPCKQDAGGIGRRLLCFLFPALFSRICESGASEVVYHEYQVHVLRKKDRARFGITANWPLINGLLAIEYRQQGHLVAWRLKLAERRQSDA